MQYVTPVIASLGLVMAALSLGWQIRSYVLNGGRVRVELRLGAADASGSHMITGPAGSTTPDSMKHLLSEGYTRPVVAVQVRNVGRLPVSITGWSLVTTPGDTALNPVGQSLGPPLHHRLEPGAEQTWAVDATMVRPFVAATAAVLHIPIDRMKVRGRVQLGDGRTAETREAV